MKIKFLALGACLVFLYSSSFAMDHPNLAQENKDEEPASWDFGKVAAGQIVKHVFVLKNISESIINIDAVTTSCGCTTSKLEKSVLKPDEATTIELEFNSKGFAGQVHKYVYVKTSAADVFAALSVDSKMLEKPLQEESAASAAAAIPQQADDSILKLIVKGEVIK
jgi:hypothetical protein